MNKNRRSISIDELHDIYYRLFPILHDFLIQNDIVYYAISGTLLGAVRHGGFVPWDDDMDIAMDRENYDKFLKICKNLDNRYFSICNYNTYIPIEHALTKICLKGVYRCNSSLRGKCDSHFHIDIFPFDHPPISEKQKIRISRELSFIKLCLYYKNRRFGATKLFKRIPLFFVKMVLFPFSCKYLAKKYEYVASTKDFGKRDETLVWVSCGVYGLQRESHDINDISETRTMKFGSTFINCPINYTSFLIDTYGNDYMTPYKRSTACFCGAIDIDEYCE